PGIPRTSLSPGVGRSTCRRAKSGGQQLVEPQHRLLSPEAEAAGLVRPAPQSALHVLADADVLELDGVPQAHALLGAPAILRPIERREVEVDYHPAAIRSVGDDDIGVHHSVVDVDHEPRERPAVARAVPAADRGGAGRATGFIDGAERTGLDRSAGEALGVV